jgi:deoxyribodipyrimidine photolyase-related protein
VARFLNNGIAPCFQGPQGSSAFQAVRHLQAADDMAQGVGAELGDGVVLQSSVSAKQGQAMTLKQLPTLRHLVVVLGDQLDLDAAAFDGFDAAQDAVWMAEVTGESTHVWSSKQRTAVFLSAMRHFGQAQQALGRSLHYQHLDDKAAQPTLASALARDIRTLKPQRLIMTAPGDRRVLDALNATAASCGVVLEIREDRHFFSTVREFAAHAQGRKQLRMEYFYRDMRKAHGVLMQGKDLSEPAGGTWNFDADNREAFPKTGPGVIPERLRHAPDAITQDVMALVKRRFADHPGTLDDFAWPVTREHALQSLDRFITERLPDFGRYQDALWPGEAWLWHAHLSSSLNLKLLSAREVVTAAENAWKQGRVPIASAEGFIRQILGWREYVRGIYWMQMPSYLERNALDAHHALPAFYWTGQTPMACMADAIGQTLRTGYAHHIQRLMVTGLYALLLGVDPKAVHQWYLAVYVDAVEWVELPNTLGMSQAADGGLMASKPYIASGKYIERQSAGSLCKGCRFEPGERTGEKACPFTTLYWDFLMRHESMLAANPRTVMQVRNLKRLSADERTAIQRRAQSVRDGALDMASN